MDKLLWTLRRRRALSAFLSMLLAVAMVLQGTAPGGIARAYADVAEQEEAAPQEAPSSEAPEGEATEGEADGEGAVEVTEPNAKNADPKQVDSEGSAPEGDEADVNEAEPADTATEPAAEARPVKMTLRSNTPKGDGVVKETSGTVTSGGMVCDWSIGWSVGDDESHHSFNNDNRLQMHPNSWEDNNTGVAMKFSFKANPSSDQGGNIPAGAISFTVPLHLFTGWDGSGVDTLDPSAQVPQAPATSNSVYFNYTVDEENNQLIIRNSRDINGGIQFDTEFGWKVNALNVDGGHPKTENADVSGSDWWMDYEDYFTNDLPVSFAVTDGGETQKADATFGLDMMTRVTGVTRAYPRPESDTTSAEPPNTYYFTWQDAWGDKPDDAGDYFYVVWVVDYGRTRNGAVTQPFKIDLEYNEDENTFDIGD